MFFQCIIIQQIKFSSLLDANLRMIMPLYLKCSSFCAY